MNGLIVKYFVLKPKGKSPYAKASRAAMRAYANSIKQENPKLWLELHQWVDDEVQANE